MHRFIRTNLAALSILLILALAGCNLPRAGGTPTQAQDAVFTAAAQTLEVELTRLAALPTTPPPPTQELVTITPNFSPPPEPSATATPIPCNRAEFVADVNFPDNAEVLPNTNFTKTWRLKNTGSCTWTSGYVLLFESGDAMGVTPTTQLTPGTVPPGATVDVSANFKAPAAPGTYRANFRLRSPENVVFGIGPTGMSQFWVQIKVPAPTATPTLTPTLTPTPTLGLIVITPIIIITLPSP